MTTTPYHWIKTVEHALEKLQQIPLWGPAPHFHFNLLSEEVSSLLEVEKIKIIPKETVWKKQEEMFAGLGTSPVFVSIELPPLSELCCFALSSEDLHKIVRSCLSKEKDFTSSHKTLEEGFYQYLLLELLQKIDEKKIFDGLSPRLSTQKFSAGEEGFVIDIKIEIGTEEIFGKLLCSQEFWKSFNKHFEEKKLPLAENALIQSLCVEMHASIGMTTLSTSELKSLSVGDFVLLDRCTFDPQTHKGHISLSLADTPIFQARYKDDNIKIMDYAVYEEIPMKQDDTPDYSDSFDEEPMDFDEISSEENSSETDTRSHEKHVASLVSKEKASIELQIEIGTISMTIEKLLQLQPGNVLELPIKPEDGVYVTLQGKKIAKGELVKLGEVLGVKILEVGK